MRDARPRCSLNSNGSHEPRVFWQLPDFVGILPDRGYWTSGDRQPVRFRGMDADGAYLSAAFRCQRPRTVRE